MNTQANVTAPAAKATKKAAKAVTETKALATETKAPVIRLTDKKPEYKGGTARALWFAAVVKANGKTPEEFADAATKKPPALKKDGKAEHPAGWLRYFVKEGIVTLAEPK